MLNLDMPRVFVEPDRSQWRDLVQRYAAENENVDLAVRQIISSVEADGDEALKALALKFDGFAPDSLMVQPSVIDAAADAVPDSLKAAIDRAVSNIAAFHKAQLPASVEVETAPGVKCFQRAVPINRVGLYIPGGRAPLFSTVLMLAVPAKIAGCPEIVMCTPANSQGLIAPAILYAARKCGIDRVYAVGGAQAIAAMAIGTASIPKVDKIFGPGNRYVTRAKELLSSLVAIDMPAGPSEVMVLADHCANPSYVAADLLSQCEHGPDSQAMLVCSSQHLASSVCTEIFRQASELPRREIVAQSLRHSRIIVLPRIEDMADFANLYAPEHLIINTVSPWDVASLITNAGSVFIGPFSPESAGDYASGTNHTLPTSGWARAFSGVNVDSFMRKITFQQLSREGLADLSGVITAMAEAEGLDAHAQAVKLRIAK